MAGWGGMIEVNDDWAEHLAADEEFGPCRRPGCPNAEERPATLGEGDGARFLGLGSQRWRFCQGYSMASTLTWVPVSMRAAAPARIPTWPGICCATTSEAGVTK